MQAIKNALLRYRIIDRAIRNEYISYPSKKDLRQLCEDEIFGSSDGTHICDSTIEKDLFAMRMEHDAPIAYSKKDKGYLFMMNSSTPYRLFQCHYISQFNSSQFYTHHLCNVSYLISTSVLLLIMIIILSFVD